MPAVSRFKTGRIALQNALFQGMKRPVSERETANIANTLAFNGLLTGKGALPFTACDVKYLYKTGGCDVQPA